MKSLRLIVCLILMVGYLTPTQAVTDAELEALEKQIEQQETEEKQQAEAAVKKKTEAEAKRKAEQKRKAELEIQRLEEEKRVIEEARLAEIEKKRKDEEEKKKKFNMLFTEAEQAVIDKDKNLAISKYNEALKLYPEDLNANLGLKNAENLKHKICYEVLGLWLWGKGFGKNTMILNEDGTIDYHTGIKGSGNWECTDPENRIIKIRLSAAGFSNEWLSTYSADGSCLLGPETWGERGCYHRKESN